MTGCTAQRFGGDHDYSQPPHNAPGDPVDDSGYGDLGSACHARSADDQFPPCDQSARYEIVIYQAGTHDWIRMLACAPCTAALRVRHERLGPGGANGIFRIRELEPGPAA